MAAVDSRTEALESSVFRLANDPRLPRSPAENYIGVISSLLAAGADVSATNRHEVTPLMMATVGNDIEIVRQLLAYDDNPGYTNSRGYSALTIANLTFININFDVNEEMIQLIRAAIAEKEAEKEEVEEEKL